MRISFLFTCKSIANPNGRRNADTAPWPTNFRQPWLCPHAYDDHRRLAPVRHGIATGPRETKPTWFSRKSLSSKVPVGDDITAMEYDGLRDKYK
ncbi:hypothetical protein B296_00022531 [Ensete ventricosum]|uniref:Uncharacterized protein n=1 Tax=Ensete ventricosum TaxID=4639 RepID=A0A426ZXV1_ENSVE|nr:hypothetical protein B296_00022531 [Ensete ventricosum]